MDKRRWEDEPTLLHECGTPIWFDDYVDASFCPACDLWLNGKCSDRECVYCAYRPEKPSQSELPYPKHDPATGMWLSGSASRGDD